MTDRILQLSKTAASPVPMPVENLRWRPNCAPGRAARPAAGHAPGEFVSRCLDDRTLLACRLPRASDWHHMRYASPGASLGRGIPASEPKSISIWGPSVDE